MKKIILLALFLSSKLFCFELLYNTGRENDQAFGVLHLRNEENFTCQEIHIDGKNHFECTVLGNVDTTLQDRAFQFFDLNFTKKDLRTDIKISPKIPAKMYNLAQDLYNDNVVLNNIQDTNSTAFTFVFSKELPYVKNYDGLEFDIVFPDATKPDIGALDLNSNPVQIPQSADINTYMRIKNEYEKQNYAQVITDTANAINRYTSSIFLNEFMLYRLRAKNKLYTYGYDFRDQEKIEEMVDEARLWTRTFTSDVNFPEVLYITMRAYMALEQRENIEYTVSILRNEHTNNYFAQLALLDYADYLLNLGDMQAAQPIYNDLYYNVSDVDLATRAALSLAKNALIQKDKNAAINLINTALRANPTYFSKDNARSLELADMLNAEQEHGLSSQIYETVLTNLNRNDVLYEPTLRKLALTLAKTNKHTDTKKYLDAYMQEFFDSEYIPLIKEASDRNFFNLPENNATFLHQRYQALMKEYANEIAAKALEYDVKLYDKENNDTAVLAYKDEIEKYSNNELKQILEKSALKNLNDNIKADNCIEASRIYELYINYDLGQKLESKKALLECFKRTSNISYAREFIDRHRQEDEIYYDLQKSELELSAKQYANVIRLSNNILNSRTMKSKEEEFSALYVKFLAQLRQDEYNDAMATLQDLQNFPMNYKMVELYHEFLLYCSQKGLNLSILTYAPKAIDFQNSQGANVYSPDLEFIYLNALQKARQNNTAIEVLKDLLKIKLSDEDRARALYTQSEIYEDMQDKAMQIQSLQTCTNISSNSNWKSLCAQKLELLNPTAP